MSQEVRPCQVPQLLVISKCNTLHTRAGTSDLNFGMQAVFRACECLGVQDVWLIGQALQAEGGSQAPDAPASPAASESRQSVAVGPASTAAAEDPAQWLSVRSFATAQHCIAALREEEQCTLWCTALTQAAKDLHAVLRQEQRHDLAQTASLVAAIQTVCRRRRASAEASQLASVSPAPPWSQTIQQTDGGEALPQRLAVAFSGSEAEGVSRELLDAGGSGHLSAPAR